VARVRRRGLLLPWALAVCRRAYTHGRCARGCMDVPAKGRAAPTRMSGSGGPGLAVYVDPRANPRAWRACPGSNAAAANQPRRRSWPVSAASNA
jgi:hypothetical protein